MRSLLCFLLCSLFLCCTNTNRSSEKENLKSSIETQILKTEKNLFKIQADYLLSQKKDEYVEIQILSKIDSINFLRGLLEKQ